MAPPKKQHAPLPPSVEEWLLAQRSDNTKLVYTRRLRQLLVELKKLKVSSPEKATSHDLLKALDAIKKTYKRRRISPATQNQIMDAWRSYYTYLARLKQIAASPAIAMPHEPKSDAVQPTPSESEMTRLWAVLRAPLDPEANPARLRRDRALFVLLALVALRGQELRSLRWSDFNWAKRALRVTGKGNKIETVYWPKAVAEGWLREYYESLDAEAKQPEAFAFTSQMGTPLTRARLIILLDEIAEAAAVRSYRPHAFRRYVATALLRKGVPITKVQKLLRHRSIETTARYIADRHAPFSADVLAEEIED